MKRNPIWMFAAAGLFFAQPLWASHKAWVLKHSGGDCLFQTPLNHSFFGADGGDIFLFNHFDFSRSAVCPINASGRWGSSGTTAFPLHRWAEAKRAWIHVYIGHPTESLTCQAVARLRVRLSPGGELYYGTARSVTGEGNHTVELMMGNNGSNPPWDNWGGSLETNESARLRSLDIQCRLPPTGNYYSYIRGYGVSTCQHLAGCRDGETLIYQSAGNEVSIQGNGSSCSSAGTNVNRGADGLFVNAAGGRAVSCPIVPPSDDSYEHGSGFFKQLRIYYTAQPGSSTCVQDGTCPSCRLSWETLTGELQSSLPFVWNSGNFLNMPTTTSIPVWTGAAINCWVPNGQTIRGYTGWGSQGLLSAGQ